MPLAVQSIINDFEGLGVSTGQSQLQLRSTALLPPHSCRLRGEAVLGLQTFPLIDWRGGDRRLGITEDPTGTGRPIEAFPMRLPWSKILNGYE